MISAGTSSLPPLSPDRVDAARRRHGAAVDQYLAHLRIGDPLADAVVDCFEGLPRGEGFRLLLQAIDRGIGSIDRPPPPLAALFDQLDHVPFWVDWERMRQGSAKVIRSGLLTAIAFATYALPHAYLATANKPLVFTGALLGSAAHRYAQTTRFVIETFMPGGLRRDADGFKIAVLVRIMHARIRRQLLRSGRWDGEALGVPVNQAHLAVNMVFFSFFVLRGLQRLGVRFRRSEIEGVLLTWRYVGHLFGIDPELVYTSPEEAERLVEVAFSVEFDPDEASVALCHAMVAAGASYMSQDHERLRRLLMPMIVPISRRLLGDRLADRLGYPDERKRLLCWLFVTAVRLSERLPGLVPADLRQFVGMQFWLESSNYDMAGLTGEATGPHAPPASR
ncbi:MAG: oxygenase MpaB family protein [Alphaproteobacteria bacterium]